MKCRGCAGILQTAAMGRCHQPKHAARLQRGLGALPRRDRPGPAAQPHQSSCLHLNATGFPHPCQHLLRVTLHRSNKALQGFAVSALEDPDSRSSMLA